MFTPTQSLADLALAVPSASRVFRKHRLDFCCGGKKSIAEACRDKGLDAESILQEIAAEAIEADTDYATRPLGEVIDHILVKYHDAHRREIPDLVELARKVERVHADKRDVPKGLAIHLATMQMAMEDHMLKEERVLFPAIRRGLGAQLAGPVHQMESEHVEHGASLATLRDLAHDFVPPEGACTSWRALYLRCEQLEADLMAHVHLENHVLFPRALESR